MLTLASRKTDERPGESKAKTMSAVKESDGANQPSERKAQTMSANEVKERLRLLSVCDAEDGSVLFERVWHWLRRESNLGNLVRSFFQIARQLDHGVVSRVVFETTHVPDDNDLRDAPPLERMQMLCTKNEQVMVALFYELPADDSGDGGDTLHTAMRQFVEQSRELWSQHHASIQFDSTLSILLNRMRATLLQ